MCEHNCENCKYYIEHLNKINYTSNRNRIKRNNRLANGLCTRCGKNPLAVVNGKQLTMCTECNDKQRKASTEYYKSKKKNK